VNKPRVSVRRMQGGAVIELHGEHDLSTKAAVERALAGVGPAETRVVDLSSATFIDSSILRTVVAAVSRDGASAPTLVVAPPRSAAARLFGLTGADDVVRLYPAMDEALARVMISE